MLLARGADTRIATKVIDYKARSSRTLRRGRPATASFRRCSDARSIPKTNINDPPPGAAAGQGGGPRPRRAIAPGAAVPGGRGGGGPRPPSDIDNIGKQGGFTALHYAARDGFADVACALLDAGLNVNLLTEGDRSTPMVVAIINGQYDLAMTFLQRGANPNLTNDDGVGPLFARSTMSGRCGPGIHSRRQTCSNRPRLWGCWKRCSRLEPTRTHARGRTSGMPRTTPDVWALTSLEPRRSGVRPTRSMSRRCACWSAMAPTPASRACRYGAPRRDNDPSGMAGSPPAARTCRRFTRPAASATARRESRSSIGTCPTAGSRPPSTSSRSLAWTSTSVMPKASPRSTTRLPAAITR